MTEGLVQMNLVRRQTMWPGVLVVALLLVLAASWQLMEQYTREVEAQRESIRAEIQREFEGVNRRMGSGQLAGIRMAEHPPGLTSTPGILSNPKVVSRLRITKPGTYSNYLIDGEFGEQTLVKITASGVILKNCEIRNSKRNAITVDSEDVIIDSCSIHHVLRGSSDSVEDAHGVTGTPSNLLVRNCDIHTVSGDCIQFDPDRKEWDKVIVKNCKLWAAPLNSDVAEYKQGDCPGENAIDTKCGAEHKRSKLVISDCYFSGWREGLIQNMAALNLKENVDALVSNSVFENNEIGLRLRGPNRKTQVGAKVTVENCRVYQGELAIRIEDNIEDLKIREIGFGPEVKERILIVQDQIGPGYEVSELFSVPTNVKRVGSGWARAGIR